MGPDRIAGREADPAGEEASKRNEDCEQDAGRNGHASTKEENEWTGLRFK
jgi:hypothetical protein